MDRTFLLLKDQCGASYLAQPYPEQYYFCSNSEVGHMGPGWWVKPFRWNPNEWASEWWEAQKEMFSVSSNWEWDGGIVYANLLEFTTVGEVSGIVNRDGVLGLQ